MLKKCCLFLLAGLIFLSGCGAKELPPANDSETLPANHEEYLTAAREKGFTEAEIQAFSIIYNQDYEQIFALTPEERQAKFQEYQEEREKEAEASAMLKNQYGLTDKQISLLGNLGFAPSEALAMPRDELEEILAAYE